MVQPQLKKPDPMSSLSRRVLAAVVAMIVGLILLAHGGGKNETDNGSSDVANSSLRKDISMETTVTKEPTTGSAEVPELTELPNSSLEPNAASPSAETTDQNKSSTESSKACEWRPEPLRGNCDGIPVNETISQAYPTAAACEEGCCAREDCFSFQFRALEGCKFGKKDSRLGAEKDGPSAWCEPRAPASWQGQWIKSRKGGEPVEGACSTDPKQSNFTELTGQCFGLGSRKQTDSHTSEACQQACCATEDCRVWQWRMDAGCFFSRKANFCNEAASQEALEPFYGKRKVIEGRSYTPYAYSKDFADLAGTEFEQN